MTWLLSDDEFRDAALTMRSGGVTRELYAFLKRIVVAQAWSGTLAPALSVTGAWDEEGADETLQSWLSERLLTGGLARSFHVCTSPRALARYLETGLRNWLISLSRARSQPRLLSRARSLLESEPEFRVVIPSDRHMDVWWGLTSWDSPTTFQGSDAALVSAAYGVGELAPIRYSAGSKLTDPIISNADLNRLLLGILEAVGGAVTLRHVDRALRGRFAYAYQELESGVDLPEDPGAEAPRTATLEWGETAKEILVELSDRQLALLHGRVVEELTLDHLAAEHSISRGTVENELRRAAAIIRTHLVATDEPEKALEVLFDVAFFTDGRNA